MPLPPPNGRRRVGLGDVYPQIDAGRHHLWRVAADEVVVAAATGGWRFTLLSRRVKA
jgi:hypothetical protein